MALELVGQSLDTYFFVMSKRKLFSCNRTELLNFKVILPSSEYFISGLRLTSGGLISSVDKPTDFHEVTSVNHSYAV